MLGFGAIGQLSIGGFRPSRAVTGSAAVKYWFNGVPLSGIVTSPPDSRGVKYWFNGVPAVTVVATFIAPVVPNCAAFSTPQAAGIVMLDMIAC